MTPDILDGKPVATGTRVPVELVVELLAQDWSTDEILAQYPALSREEFRRACTTQAKDCSLSASTPWRKFRRLDAASRRPERAPRRREGAPRGRTPFSVVDDPQMRMRPLSG